MSKKETGTRGEAKGMPLTIKGCRVSKDYLIKHGIIKDYFNPIEKKDDSISRQVAIDAFYKYPNINWTTLDVLAKINALPSTQSEQQWIPCSERLPKKSGQYYVSGGGKVWICEFLIIPNFTGGWCNNAVDPVVQAWMPLPEPYKGK